MQKLKDFLALESDTDTFSRLLHSKTCCFHSTAGPPLVLINRATFLATKSSLSQYTNLALRLRSRLKVETFASLVLVSDNERTVLCLFWSLGQLLSCNRRFCNLLCKEI